MKYSTVLFLFFVASTGCYQRQDPLVRAAQDLQDLATDFAAREEDRIQQFTSLRLGMSQDEVLRAVGAPASRQILSTSDDDSRELWTYRGAMRPLGTLTFTNQRLTEIRSE
ncbi:MAG: hypothetical protein AB7G75_07305 [Candidatus Binatia bacterium]